MYPGSMVYAKVASNWTYICRLVNNPKSTWCRTVFLRFHWSPRWLWLDQNSCVVNGDFRLFDPNSVVWRNLCFSEKVTFPYYYYLVLQFPLSFYYPSLLDAPESVDDHFKVQQFRIQVDLHEIDDLYDSLFLKTTINSFSFIVYFSLWLLLSSFMFVEASTTVWLFWFFSLLVLLSPARGLFIL